VSTFTDESMLLIENWDTVRDILRAHDSLSGELITVLNSLESELAQMPWWPDQWHFAQTRRAQVYISNGNWRQGDGYAVWIGVERVSPDHLFGSGPAANLYVWIRDNDALLAELIRQRQNPGEELPGEVDLRTSNGYVVREAIGQYIGGDVEAYVAELRAQILGFFGTYAQWLWGIDEAIRRHL